VSTNLTPSEREVLALLAAFEQASWSELLDFFPGSKASLARALAELEKKGYIQKIELPRTRARRRIIYELTEQGKKVLEEGKEEVVLAIRGITGVLVIRGIIFLASRLARAGKAEKAEQAIRYALGELLLSAFTIAYRWSKGVETDFEKRLREVQRLLQPVIWTAWWALYDFSKRHPDVFNQIMEKELKKIERRH